MTLPDGCPPSGDWPDDFVTQRELAAGFGLTVATIRDWMRGHKGKPPLPYFRIGKVPLFSKSQVAWWLRQVQAQVDVAMVEVRHARNELGKT